MAHILLMVHKSGPCLSAIYIYTYFFYHGFFNIYVYCICLVVHLFSIKSGRKIFYHCKKNIDADFPKFKSSIEYIATFTSYPWCQAEQVDAMGFQIGFLMLLGLEKRSPKICIGICMDWKVWQMLMHCEAL